MHECFVCQFGFELVTDSRLLLAHGKTKPGFYFLYPLKVAEKLVHFLTRHKCSGLEICKMDLPDNRHGIWLISSKYFKSDYDYKSLHFLIFIVRDV